MAHLYISLQALKANLTPPFVGSSFHFALREYGKKGLIELIFIINLHPV